MTLRYCSVFFMLFLCSCGDPELPQVSSKLLDSEGDFTLVVSNQSFSLKKVDIRVAINNELVVSDYFFVDDQHTYVRYKLSLPNDKNKIKIWSNYGDTTLTKVFNLDGQGTGVVNFWTTQSIHSFTFQIQNRPFIIE